jgi:hypothetical protein
MVQGVGRVAMIPPTFKGDVDEEVDEFVSNYLACAKGNGWGDALALTNLSYYLRGRARAVYDSAVRNGTFVIPSVTGAAMEALKARVKVEPSELRAEYERLSGQDQATVPQLEALRAALVDDPTNVTEDMVEAFATLSAQQATRGTRMGVIREQLSSLGAASSTADVKAAQEATSLEEVMDWLRGEFTYEHTRDARVGAFLRKKQRKGESARSHAHALLLLHRQAGLEYNKQQLCATFVNSLQEDLKRLMKSQMAVMTKDEKEDWSIVRELADSLEKKYFHLVNPSRNAPAVGRAAAMEAGDGGEYPPGVAAVQAGPPRRPFKEVECYKCGRKGHISPNCPTASDRRPMRGNGAGRGRPPTMPFKQGLRCFECGQVGHFARECPERTQGRQGAPGRRGAPGHRSGGAARGAAPGGDAAQKLVAALQAMVSQQTPLNE